MRYTEEIKDIYILWQTLIIPRPTKILAVTHSMEMTGKTKQKFVIKVPSDDSLEECRPKVLKSLK